MKLNFNQVFTANGYPANTLTWQSMMSFLQKVFSLFCLFSHDYYGRTYRPQNPMEGHLHQCDYEVLGGLYLYPITPEHQGPIILSTSLGAYFHFHAILNTIMQMILCSNASSVTHFIVWLNCPWDSMRESINPTLVNKLPCNTAFSSSHIMQGLF